MNRRSLLLGAAAVALTPMLPDSAVAAVEIECPMSIGIDVGPDPATWAFVKRWWNAERQRVETLAISAEDFFLP